MSVLRAGNTTLEDGKVRICVPIAYETEKEILEESVRIGKSSVADIAEWRIDWYQDVFQPRKRNALAKKIRENLQGKPLLVTFRSRREGGERDITPAAYQVLLDEVIESNIGSNIGSNTVDLLDVELELIVERCHLTINLDEILCLKVSYSICQLPDFSGYASCLIHKLQIVVCLS